MRLPLFPLHTVLFPHLPLPLHVFEPRYRAMMGDLLGRQATPGGRFVVVRIVEGSDVAVADAPPPRLEQVGTMAEIRSAERFADGRYALLAVGTERVALGAIDERGPYATVEVTPLPEAAGDRAGELLPEVQAALDGYLAGVKRFVASAASSGGEDGAVSDLPGTLDALIKPIQLPDDPLAASYVVAGVIQVDLAHKQQLLEEADAASRLRAELALLRRETSLLTRRGLSPVGNASLHYHPN